MVCLPKRDRPDFNPSPFSTRYPNLGEVIELFENTGFDVRVYGNFAVEPASSRDRWLDGIRHVAVRYNLIPGSMRAKAIVKRMLYGKLPTLGAVHGGMADYAEPIELDRSAGSDNRNKNLYAVGVARSRRALVKIPRRCPGSSMVRKP